ncbi:uncharacterized protein [Emydura macquarii macquarii]|uniref:uncharacterized protein n=1 Tax=Emydura macquarii macquarii TaxID=1129001 RepID=UPI003529F989
MFCYRGMVNFVTNHLLEATIVITLLIVWYKDNVMGITVTSGQVYRCQAKNPSIRERNISVGGERPLPSAERIVDIFTGMEEEKCNIYWNQKLTEIPNMNTTKHTTKSTTLHKGSRTATIMGQLFRDKKVKGKCVWYTPFEEIFKRSLECNTVQMNPKLCIEMRWYTPKIMTEGNYHFRFEATLIETNQSIWITLYIGAQMKDIEIPCRRLATPKKGYGMQNPYCENSKEEVKWVCTSDINIDVTPLDSGDWVIYGPHESHWWQENVVVGKPIVSKSGPVVVGRQLKRKLLIQPQYALVHLDIDLDVRVDTEMPICNQYTKTIRQGWINWIQNIDDTIGRHKRDIVSTLLGGIGTGLGAVNTIDLEVLASKIGKIGTELNTLDHPLGTSLTELSSIQHKVTELLPAWFRTRQQDLNTLIKA